MPVEYIEEAIRRGMRSLGFSCHAPVPFPTSYTMKEGRLPEYKAAIGALKTQYSDRIDVYCGLEIDYIPGIVSPADPVFSELGLDYFIGSVHVGGTFASGEHWMVDSGHVNFAKGIEQIYSGNARAAVEEYYRRTALMVSETKPDIVGHFDLVKRSNAGNIHFDEGAGWYIECSEATLQAVARSDSIIEVNTGGLARGRCDSLFPSDRLLKRILELGIPVTISADAHDPTFLTALFPETAERLLQMGFREIYVM